LLYDGDSSRLYQKLVKGEESVIQLFGFTDERRGPSSIFIGAIPKPEKDLSRIRETIMHEVQSLATHGPTPEEMQKLHNQLFNDAVRMRQSSMTRAQQIAEFALYDGSPALINQELEELLAVTPDAFFNHPRSTCVPDCARTGSSACESATSVVDAPSGSVPSFPSRRARMPVFGRRHAAT
jgi:predicted Zn-dependent peptidase